MTKISKKINFIDLDLCIYDFDGVFTDNTVSINEKSEESVVCNRADGLAIDYMRKMKIKMIILSSEKNKVIKARAKKLKITCIQGINKKANFLKRFFVKNNYNPNKCLYVGNDLNDFHAMKLCGYRACPSDSHARIKKISNLRIKKKGGEGVIREIAENFFDLDLLS